MGQDLSKGCGCGEAAEDPQLEHRTELENKDARSAEHVVPRSVATAPAAHHAHAAHSAPAPASTSRGGAGWGGEEEEGLFVPPPPGEAASPAPSRAAAPSAAPAHTGASPSPAVGTSKIDYEFLLLDLEGAENTVYSEVFAKITDRSGSAQPDNAQLRDFVTHNTAIVPSELDTELLKIASLSESFSIDLAGFLRVLRENPVAEGDALQQFLGLTANGEDISSEDCRTGLLHLLHEKLRSSLSEEQANRAFDAVMVDAGLTVSMEQWVAYAKRVARIARLAKLGQ